MHSSHFHLGATSPCLPHYTSASASIPCHPHHVLSFSVSTISNEHGILTVLPAWITLVIFRGGILVPAGQPWNLKTLDERRKKKIVHWMYICRAQQQLEPRTGSIIKYEMKTYNNTWTGKASNCLIWFVDIFITRKEDKPVVFVIFIIYIDPLNPLLHSLADQ